MDTMCLKEVKAKGFTAKLIEELLPEPILKPNPKYKCAAPMKIWQTKIVEEAMQTDTFKNAQSARLKRQAAAKKGVQTKTVKLQNTMQEYIDEVRIMIIDVADLRSLTIEAKQEWYDYLAMCSDTGYEFIDSAKDADDATINRWMVNYVRHNLTEYEDGLDELFGRVGKDSAYLMLFSGILNKISTAYPMLKDECERQIKRKEMLKHWSNYKY